MGFRTQARRNRRHVEREERVKANDDRHECRVREAPAFPENVLADVGVWECILKLVESGIQRVRGGTFEEEGIEGGEEDGVDDVHEEARLSPQRGVLREEHSGGKEVREELDDNPRLIESNCSRSWRLIWVKLGPAVDEVWYLDGTKRSLLKDGMIEYIVDAYLPSVRINLLSKPVWLLNEVDGDDIVGNLSLF